ALLAGDFANRSEARRHEVELRGAAGAREAGVSEQIRLRFAERTQNLGTLTGAIRNRHVAVVDLASGHPILLRNVVWSEASPRILRGSRPTVKLGGRSVLDHGDLVPHIPPGSRRTEERYSPHGLWGAFVSRARVRACVGVAALSLALGCGDDHT